MKWNKKWSQWTKTLSKQSSTWVTATSVTSCRMNLWTSWQIFTTTYLGSVLKKLDQPQCIRPDNAPPYISSQEGKRTGLWRLHTNGASLRIKLMPHLFVVQTYHIAVYLLWYRPSSTAIYELGGVTVNLIQSSYGDSF